MAAGRTVFTGKWEQQHGYAKAVRTSGGDIVWLAGVTSPYDASGNSLAGDIDKQLDGCFEKLAANIEEANGTFTDLTVITIYLTDSRYAQAVEDAMHRNFPDKNFPAGTMVTVDALAITEIMVEISGVAVISE